MKIKNYDFNQIKIMKLIITTVFIAMVLLTNGDRTGKCTSANSILKLSTAFIEKCELSTNSDSPIVTMSYAQTLDGSMYNNIF